MTYDNSDDLRKAALAAEDAARAAAGASGYEAQKAAQDAAFFANQQLEQQRVEQQRYMEQQAAERRAVEDKATNDAMMAPLKMAATAMVVGAVVEGMGAMTHPEMGAPAATGILGVGLAGLFGKMAANDGGEEPAQPAVTTSMSPSAMFGGMATSAAARAEALGQEPPQDTLTVTEPFTAVMPNAPTAAEQTVAEVSNDPVNPSSPVRRMAAAPSMMPVPVPKPSWARTGNQV